MAVPHPLCPLVVWLRNHAAWTWESWRDTVEHVLMSSVWALHRQSNRWTKWHVLDHTLPWSFVCTHYLRGGWFPSQRAERDIAENDFAITYHRYFAPFISVWSWSTWNVWRHTSAWCTLTSCCNMCHITERKPNTLKSLCTLLGLVALELQEKEWKALLKAPTDALLQAYKAALK